MNADRYAHNIAYDQFDLPTAMPMGNGVTQTWTYNNRLQPTWIIGANSGGNIFAVVNHYDAGSNNGNVVSQTYNGATAWENHAYSYDDLNRLTKDASTLWTEQYAYDRFGNRAVTERVNLPNLTGETPDQVSDYNAWNNRIGGFGYDPRGNMTWVPGRYMAYDGENRMTAMERNGVPNWFAYDGENRRVGKIALGMPHYNYIYDAFGRLALETDGTALIEHIYGLGHLATENGATGRRYYTNDHLGSTRMLTDAAGARLDTPDYLPFGEEVGGAGCGTVASGVKFTGQYRDQESCLDNFVARYMSPAQGRFTSPDAFFADQHEGDPQSWNLYAYGRNNPLVYTDPTGEVVTFYPNHGSPFTVDDWQYWGYDGYAGVSLPYLNIGGPEFDYGIYTQEGYPAGLAVYTPDPGRFNSGPAGGGEDEGGGGGGTPLTPEKGRRAEPPKGCPPVPQTPPGVDINRNMSWSRVMQIATYNSPALSLYAFKKAVNLKGPWDYKQLDKTKYEDIGNFNFGAAGSAWGIPLNILQRGAGWAQGQGGNTSPKFGSWDGGFPYGDDPRDQALIYAGYLYYKNGCYKN